MELNVCRYLYDGIKDGPLASTFGFVHPIAISLAGGSTSRGLRAEPNALPTA